jgi:hypothetical protein
MAVTAIEIGRGGCGGGPAGVDAGRRPARLRDQPEAVAADAVHVGIDHGDGRGGGDHGFDGVAALAQHGQPCLGGQMMGGDHHAPAGGRRLQHDRTPADTMPIFKALFPVRATVAAIARCPDFGI